MGAGFLNFDYSQFTDRVLEFCVEFYDESSKLRRKYRNSIRLNCTEGEYLKCLDDHESEIDYLETTYGILDGEGSKLKDGSWSMGYNSYEISYEDAQKVWDKLCEILAPYIVKW